MPTARPATGVFFALALAGLLAMATVPAAAEGPNPARSCRDVDFQEPCVVVCPATALTAEGHGDGSITVRADVNDTADLYRSEDGGDPELAYGFAPSQTSFHDVNTTVGSTYTYHLVVGPAVCAEVEVTAVPVFGSLVAMALASAAGIAGYVTFRARR